MVVEEYQRGGISQRALVAKHGIRGKRQVECWIKLYNGHEELRSYKRTDGGVDMAKGRKTTYEERVEIVEYCLKNGEDYTAAAEKYAVPYGRVYDWVKKYNKGGVAALKDNRGKGKDIEDMDEKERLAAENRLLRAKVERLEIEIEFKKKLEEVRMRLESGTRWKK
jgi:transposase